MSTSGSEAKRGTVYTFYSFKGGTGRTMALANVATLMAKWDHSVLVIDWDLEAPGIERFFASSHTAARKLRASSPGIIDLMQGWAEGKEVDWRSCILELESGVSLISAGREDGDYVSRLQKIDFESLFDKRNLGQYIERLRTEWISSFDFVLIDSRTGVTDIGGICTAHLPDVLVLFFTATDSSTQGAIQIVERARKAQERLPLDREHLIAVPVPSRDESRTEYNRALQWKKLFAERFGDLYTDWLPSGVNPQEAVELLRIPYVPYWSFGEQLPVVVEGTSDPTSLGYAYEILARLLVTRLSWYEAIQGRMLPPAPTLKLREIDKNWLERHRAAALNGVKKSAKPGFMEVYHLCTDSNVTKPQGELLTIAEQSAIHTFGWPIGVVLRNRPEFRPRPTNDGIVANIDSDHDYDYWTLTKRGDFYSLMSLFEDKRAQKAIFFDTRIVRTTEAILHGINIYQAFGVEPSATVALTIRYYGLRGRTLTAANPNRSLYFSSGQNLNEDHVITSVNFHVGVSEPEIVGLVKALCEPLFVIFDFAKFGDETYGQIVSNYIQGKVV